MDLYLLLVTVSATIFTLLCSTIFFIVYGKFRVQENKIIASSSPPSPKSSLPRNWTPDVFPSFHGADVRKSFLSHFLKECRSKAISLFIDNEITRGEYIGPELKKAIQGSRIAIVLLSKRYASSSWCLDELVEIMKCKEELGQTVIPVFYKVDPTDVKKQAGEFGKVFKETCKGKRNEVIVKWSLALAKVATLAGYHSKNWDNEAKMVEDVATEVAKKLFNSTPSRDFDEFIGMEAHMNKISRVLRTDLDEVRMIGIWGPAGIGKTTIARCLFNQLSDTFQYSVFMMNVKTMYTPPVCSDDYTVKLHLQQKLLSQLTNQKEEDLKISHLGVAQERLKDKKVLVVLDNVDRLVQLEAMAKKTGWFGNGSRIIITTQDRKILKAHGITDIYKVDFPSDREAIQMFCMYAFGQKSPEDGFEMLVWQVTRLAGRLPLGLRVMGSYFRGMSKEEWENTLPGLRMCLDGEIESILMFSYNALSHENKDLFLHIACFFNYGWIEKVVEHLSKRFSDVRQQLNVLAEKSLIFLEIGRVSMHDMLVQLGGNIVRKQPTEPGQRQFLVDKREICEVLADGSAGSRSVIGIKFYGNKINVSERAFEGMSNLQFLRIRQERDGEGDTFHLFGGPSYLSRQLRLLDWKYFPMTCLHCIPNPELLVELIMFCSKLEKLWEGTKLLSNLKWVRLRDSKNLKDVSSLSTATSLQELDLTGCSSLVKLPYSIGNATNLQFLSLRSCSSLVELPSSIGNAIRNLEVLDFFDCSSLEEVPSSIGNATNLKHLNFSRCSSLVELPASIGNLHKLESLNLKKCCKLEVLPVNINLKSLRELDLADCSLMKSFPEISTNIEYLDLTGTAIKQVPSSIRSVHEQHRNTRDFSLDQENLSSSSTCTQWMQRAFVTPAASNFIIRTRRRRLRVSGETRLLLS
ncbi:probable disease resistance protein RPP1 isoform X2 [Brassica napus]|uniref:probable disease resistance protein RPP1 isoform X2 n=1 Tax=Brassica napus TaxID=3708 RepID=UPI002078DA71|nr:probable disease resistance protein RPP1 isoform X2 [Brassica napus]